MLKKYPGMNGLSGGKEPVGKMCSFRFHAIANDNRIRCLPCGISVRYRVRSRIAVWAWIGRSAAVRSSRRIRIPRTSFWMLPLLLLRRHQQPWCRGCRCRRDSPTPPPAAPSSPSPPGLTYVNNNNNKHVNNTGKQRDSPTPPPAAPSSPSPPGLTYVNNKNNTSTILVNNATL